MRPLQRGGEDEVHGSRGRDRPRPGDRVPGLDCAARLHHPSAEVNVIGQHIGDDGACGLAIALVVGGQGVGEEVGGGKQRRRDDRLGHNDERRRNRQHAGLIHGEGRAVQIGIGPGSVGIARPPVPIVADGVGVDPVGRRRYDAAVAVVVADFADIPHRRPVPGGGIVTLAVPDLGLHPAPRPGSRRNVLHVELAGDGGTAFADVDHLRRRAFQVSPADEDVAIVIHLQEIGGNGDFAVRRVEPVPLGGRARRGIDDVLVGVGDGERQPHRGGEEVIIPRHLQGGGRPSVEAARQVDPLAGPDDILGVVIDEGNLSPDLKVIIVTWGERAPRVGDGDEGEEVIAALRHVTQIAIELARIACRSRTAAVVQRPGDDSPAAEALQGGILATDEDAFVRLGLGDVGLAVGRRRDDRGERERLSVVGNPLHGRRRAEVELRHPVHLLHRTEEEDFISLHHVRESALIVDEQAAPGAAVRLADEVAPVSRADLARPGHDGAGNPDRLTDVGRGVGDGGIGDELHVVDGDEGIDGSREDGLVVLGNLPRRRYGDEGTVGQHRARYGSRIHHAEDVVGQHLTRCHRTDVPEDGLPADGGGRRRRAAEVDLRGKLIGQHHVADRGDALVGYGHGVEDRLPDDGVGHAILGHTHVGVDLQGVGGDVVVGIEVNRAGEDGRRVGQRRTVGRQVVHGEDKLEEALLADGQRPDRPCQRAGRAAHTGGTGQSAGVGNIAHKVGEDIGDDRRRVVAAFGGVAVGDGESYQVTGPCARRSLLGDGEIGSEDVGTPQRRGEIAPVAGGAGGGPVVAVVRPDPIGDALEGSFLVFRIPADLIDTHTFIGEEIENIPVGEVNPDVIWIEDEEAARLDGEVGRRDRPPAIAVGDHPVGNRNRHGERIVEFDGVSSGRGVVVDLVEDDGATQRGGGDIVLRPLRRRGVQCPVRRIIIAIVAVGSAGDRVAGRGDRGRAVGAVGHRIHQNVPRCIEHHLVAVVVQTDVRRLRNEILSSCEDDGSQWIDPLSIGEIPSAEVNGDGERVVQFNPFGAFGSEFVDNQMSRALLHRARNGSRVVGCNDLLPAAHPDQEEEQEQSPYKEHNHQSRSTFVHRYTSFFTFCFVTLPIPINARQPFP